MFLVGLSLAAARVAQSAPPRYALLDLGSVLPAAINNRGQIAGNEVSGSAGGIRPLYRAVLWENGRKTDLGTLPLLSHLNRPFNGQTTVATGINDRGQVVGYATVGADEIFVDVYHAWVWEDGRMTDLGALTADRSSYAWDINNDGRIVGASENARRRLTTVLWQHGLFTDLGIDFDGDLTDEGYGINDVGQVVGYVYSPGGTTLNTVPYLWENGQARGLGAFSGTEGFNNRANAINNRGQVVGASRLDTFGYHAFLWENGELRDLGTQGSLTSEAVDINDLSQVVGFFRNNSSSDNVGAFLWEAGGMTDLRQLISPDRIWQFTEARGINNAGQIVGLGRSVSDEPRGFLLTPTASLRADVSLAVTDTPDPARAGRSLTYTFSVRNQGPDPASGVIVTCRVPTGTEFVSVDSSQGIGFRVEDAVTINLGDLAVGAGATATLIVSPTAPGNVSLAAQVAANEPDPVPANNAVTAQTEVGPPQADLAIALDDTPDPVRAGQSLTYAFSVTNNGPDTVADGRLSLSLPPGVAFVSAQSSQGTSSQAGDTVTFALGSLASGSSMTGTVVVTPPARGTLTATARVTSGATDLVASNDAASVSTTVTNVSVDLALAASATPDPARVGQSLTYRFTVRNRGLDPVPGVTVIDRLPEGVEFVSATPRFSRAGQEITLALGDLGGGASVEGTIVVRPTAGGVITHTAHLGETAADTDPSNNTVTLRTSVIRASGPDLTGAWGRINYVRRRQGRRLVSQLVGRFTVRNIGNQSATRTLARFYLSSDRTLDAADLVAYQVEVPRLRAWQIWVRRQGRRQFPTIFRFNVPGGPGRGSAVQGKYVILVVDPAPPNLVPEANEENNIHVSAPLP